MLRIITFNITLFIFSSLWAQSAEQYYWSGLDKINNTDSLDYIDYEGAILDFTKAIELDSLFFDAYLQRALNKSITADYTGAIKDYTKALELRPDTMIALLNRGIAYRNFGSKHDAIKDFNRMILLYPNKVSGYTERGYTKFELNDYRGAILDYDLAITLEPNYYSFYMRGAAYFNLNLYEQAISDLNKSIELNHQYGFIFQSRGLCKIQAGYLNEGCLDLKKAGEMGATLAYEFIREKCN